MAFVGAAAAASLSVFTPPTRTTSSSFLCPARCTLSRPQSTLHSPFLLPPTSLSFLSSSFSGLSLSVNFNFRPVVREKRRVLTVRAGKPALCLTKRNRSRKSLARTHGFRRRMRTTGGRAILKRRRAKGRKVLCPKSYPNSGKRA